eukprot:scpid73187/ scgid16979/ 
MAEFPRVMIQSRSFPVAAVLLVISLLFTRSDALTKPDTSLKTLPVAYFGGVAVHPRAQASYDMLAKMRIVVIEKWEGPCWDLCLANVSKGLQCQPSCHGEFYMMDTLQRVKKANPSVATGYYQNTLYMWRYQSLYGDFAAHDECLRALNGSIAGLENDNGMQNVPVFSHDKPDDVERYGEWLENLTATGFIDGTYLDKGQVFSNLNESTNTWQVCEGATGSDRHQWIHACIPVSETIAKAYDQGKSAVLNKSIEVFTKSGGFILSPRYPSNLRTTHLSKSMQATFRKIEETLADPVVDYLFFSCGDDHRQTDGNDTSSHCSPEDVALFLLVVEKGMFLGTNGWSDEFSNPLGNPLGNATEAGKVWSRKFSSGTSVTYDEKGGKAEIHWATWD